ncbi:MAG: hypothetical protein A2408_03065 [Candidatus Yonathbacteria bacterium RIFOXYC1_FULL_52_10]|uniref:UPF0102 protein A2591_01250 n=1 Tax=Candidatus Yonathbacteria bacterium RIFOXYD1_FULL_52_36 TaxID=1802730 RepID=A0A1G2SIY9_9BACT|nr:MAG: hypothetical protein A2408_03065 [Candidatus Yonathbacteria bacterium RIFOXYC1_FULL_52_10]OHA84934.1 MAG: hypothetical protein A2591_01250 [Candidatus Yonathbacteria bacterium RIFOXYD1_FULL_52_36]
MGNKNVPKTKKIGNLGEDIATRYLKSKGFSVIARNYTKKFGEIDIVARKQGTIHFIEVKTVSREIFDVNQKNVSRETDEYAPEDNIHPWKIKRMVRTAEAYLAEMAPEGEVEWQCDAIAILLDIGRRRSVVRMTEHIV